MARYSKPVWLVGVAFEDTDGIAVHDEEETAAACASIYKRCGYTVSLMKYEKGVFYALPIT